MSSEPDRQRLAESGRFRDSRLPAYDAALNHPNFTNPSANVSVPASFGVVSGTKGALLGEPSDRNVDFILQLMF